jgi:hypothetical protein
MAVAQGHLKTVKFLPCHPSLNKDKTNKNGETAAFFVKSNNQPMIDLLTSHGITKGKRS